MITGGHLVRSLTFNNDLVSAAESALLISPDFSLDAFKYLASKKKPKLPLSQEVCTSLDCFMADGRNGSHWAECLFPLSVFYLALLDLLLSSYPSFLLDIIPVDFT
ncbi:hypothetical protein DSO57_1029151 [Entomophthora muscae]|uniref:Uncharacterized protein n=1 Tax=Entomophthora muscae TaxID=34485 RepID=A0ACC2ULN9_9FUNG|nr:hypothetical protein DSO57_1029151 [Entomophthora muscae]